MNLRDFFLRISSIRKKRMLRPTKPDVTLYDVSTAAAEFDPTALDVIQWTPAWMTSAERLLIYTLIFGLRPQRYLEIGTFRGGSALIVSAALDAVKSTGRMFCIDPNPCIDPEHWQRIQHRTTVLTGASPQILAEANKAAGGLFDFVLIDGDHSYTGALRDAEGILPFVADGAYVLFHDSYFYEVTQAIDDFVNRHREVIDCGPLTRETTVEKTQDNQTIYWGGLRMVQIRKR